jgi:hypothetical protein
MFLSFCPSTKISRFTTIRTADCHYTTR